MATIERAAARLLLRGRMAFSASALLPLPSPSSDDEFKTLPTLPVLEPVADSPPSQWLNLERDCKKKMKALARSGYVDEVVDLFAELRRRFADDAGVLPNVQCHNTLLRALADAGRVEDFAREFDEMCAAGVAPNVSTFNILVRVHARASNFEAAYGVISSMQELGVEPDVGTYSTLIAGLCGAGRLHEAWGLLESMVEEGCCPTVHTYNPIVQGYCREGRIQQAMELMAGMEHAGCPPNVVTYTILIKALCDHARFDDVAQVLVESRINGWKPNTVTYNTYMDGLLKKGMVKEALKQLDIMRAEGLDPTVYTFSIFLNCLCHNLMISEAIFYLERDTTLNLCADVVAYNTVMSRLCDVGRWPCALKLVTDMIKKGINPDTWTFTILIHGLCIGRKFSIAKNMLYNQGFAADVVTYSTLIHRFYFNGKFNGAHDLFSEMSSKIDPDEVAYTIIVDGLCREGNFDEAIYWFLESYKRGMWRKPLSIIINRLVRSGKINEVLGITYIFRNREEKDFLPDYNIFDRTIRSFHMAGFCQDRKFDTLNIVLDRMLGKKKT